MGSIPPKAVTGQNFKKWVIDTLNKLIDYLHGARIKPGYGIMVRETPSGTIVELAKKQAAPVNNTTGGGTGVAQDISATVSGGTATVALSGSTSSVEFVGTGDVSISGNTNGQIEISATGGTASVGFPDYFSANIVDNLAFFTVYGPYNYPVWLIGKVNSVIDGDEYRGDLTVWVFGGTNSKRIDAFNADIKPIDTLTIVDFGSLINIPIPAGNSFRLDWVGADPDISGLKIYPCI